MNWQRQNQILMLVMLLVVVCSIIGLVLLRGKYTKNTGYTVLTVLLCCALLGGLVVGTLTLYAEKVGILMKMTSFGTEE